MLGALPYWSESLQLGPHQSRFAQALLFRHPWSSPEPTLRPRNPSTRLDPPDPTHVSALGGELQLRPGPFGPFAPSCASVFSENREEARSRALTSGCMGSGSEPFVRIQVSTKNRP